jgi:RNA polymerase sigma-70 factor (ECF subfamily)
LITLASRRLAGVLRHKVDPEDLVQSVFKSFFAQQAATPFALQNWDNLWALLTTITLRKCGFRLRYFLTQRRSVRREAQLAWEGEDDQASWQALARDPTPLEAACLAETVEELLQGQDPKHRRIVELTLQGVSLPEIGTQVGLTERTVYRVLERVQSKLLRLSGKE